MREHAFFKKGELALLGLLAAAAAAALLLWPRAPGMYAQVSYHGETVQQIPLDADGLYAVEADLPVTLEVVQGKIRFVHSRCPDKLCEGFGWIGEEYQYAICLPAGVAVQIMAEE